MLAHLSGRPWWRRLTLAQLPRRFGRSWPCEKGDVLLLPNRLSDPIGLSVQTVPILIGLPVEIQGHYGLEVSGTGLSGPAEQLTAVFCRKSKNVQHPLKGFYDV